MVKQNNCLSVFFSLLRAGLWDEDIKLSSYKDTDFTKVYQLAKEQSVVGLVASGLELVKDVKIPREVTKSIAAEVLHLEQRNISMNQFIADIVQKMSNAGITVLILKGQGVAQCYERPLWRSSGDVDFFVCENCFIKAREYLRPLVVNGFNPSFDEARNISAKIGKWNIELHSNQSCGLSSKMDRVIKQLQDDVFNHGNVRSWINGQTQVLLPGVDDDVLFIFTHLLKHFYKGGLGLRQLCDWCRLLWKYKDKLNVELLEKRLRAMRLMSEWKAFGAYAIYWLGMPPEAMVLCSRARKWRRKAHRINQFVIRVGNMGHNRDNRFYRSPFFLVRKIGAFGRRMGDLFWHARLFPLDTFVFMPTIIINGLRSAIKGVG